MRCIELILTNNINLTRNENVIFKFDKNKSNKEELKKIVIDINKSESKMISLITNEEKLFEFFNRRIICMRIENNEAYDFESMKEDAQEIIKNEYILDLNTNTMHFGNVVKENLYDNISKNIITIICIEESFYLFTTLILFALFLFSTITSPINNLNYSIILYGKNRCKKIITQRVV